MVSLTGREIEYTQSDPRRDPLKWIHSMRNNAGPCIEKSLIIEVTDYSDSIQTLGPEIIGEQKFKITAPPGDFKTFMGRLRDHVYDYWGGIEINESQIDLTEFSLQIPISIKWFLPVYVARDDLGLYQKLCKAVNVGDYYESKKIETEIQRSIFFHCFEDHFDRRTTQGDIVSSIWYDSVDNIEFTFGVSCRYKN